jgi:hypothetical protein
MHPLAKRLRDEADSYAKLRAEAEAKVTRWAHYTGVPWHWHLHGYMTLGSPPRHRPGKPTTRGKALTSYGYDDQARVVFMADRPYVGGEPLEYFLRYDGDAVHGTGAHDKRVGSAFQLKLDGAHVVEEHSVGDPSWPVHSMYFTWQADHVASMRYHIEGQKIDSVKVYDVNGWTVEEYRIRQDGSRVPERDPSAPAPSLKDLLANVRNRLLELIPRTLGMAKVSEPVYCLVLAYDGEGNGVLPPALGVGLESERKDWLKQHGAKAKNYVWNPAEFQHYEKKHTQLNDEELDDWCSQLNDLLDERGSDAPARKLLCEIAGELGARNWRGKLKVTPDFVAYAVDYELAQLRRNMKQSVPAEKLQRLKEQKLL